MAKVLAAEGFQVLKETVWATIQKYKIHETISRLPRSGRPLKLTRKMLDAIEERMKQDDETTATQLMKFQLLILDADSRYSFSSYLDDSLPSYLIRIFSDPLRNCMQLSATVATNERTPILKVF